MVLLGYCCNFMTLKPSKNPNTCHFSWLLFNDCSYCAFQQPLSEYKSVMSVSLLPQTRRCFYTQNVLPRIFAVYHVCTWYTAYNIICILPHHDMFTDFHWRHSNTVIEEDTFALLIVVCYSACIVDLRDKLSSGHTPNLWRKRHCTHCNTTKLQK